MVFSSTLFLFVFLPVTMLVYLMIPWRVKNAWLLLVSLVFFAWSQPGYLWIILVSICINYVCALFMSLNGKLRKPMLFCAVTADLLLLFYFKYYNFTVGTVNTLFGQSLPLREIVLPVGISFFTFQGLSYVIDVYRGDVDVQKNPFKAALYIVLFPQLIAGPIVRYTTIEREIDHRTVSVEDISDGIERFITGLAKKAVIANTMAVVADAVWENGATSNLPSVAWAGSICYMLQIYYDFSGYSDMAIGLGRMLGFHFNENFRLPYVADSIRDFWRRWHISLSTWFRDYVYIPLGGNRRHVYLNLVIVFLLTGIWHGASWHFVVWGMWHGTFILAERLIGYTWAQASGSPRWYVRLCGKLYTLLVVNIGWVIFRAPGTGEALRYLGTMFGVMTPDHPGYTVSWYLNRWALVIMAAGIFFASSLPGKAAHFIQSRCSVSVWMPAKYLCLLVLLYISVLRIVAGTYNPFIYFQF